jgi:DNA-binding LytR/AlgR family response regulator
MTPLKIGIVEDDLIIAEAISEMLRECGYTVTEPAMRYTEAIAMIEAEMPDLLLLDVNILGRMDGVEVGRTARQVFGIPFIFLTANTDFDTISRAREVAPSAFLAKPITKAQLYAAIEIAMANYTLPVAAALKPGISTPAQQPLFVKDGYNFRKVDQTEILYAESEQNYVGMQLSNGRRVSMRGTLSEFESRLDPQHFLRTHRGFVVRIDKIEQIAGSALTVGGREIPVSKANRELLLRTLGIKD